MSLPVIIRPLAEADIEAIRSDLDAKQSGLGDRFADRLADRLEQIEFMPELFGLTWRNVRAVRVKKFRFVVYYVVYSDRVEVIAVMHGARDSSAWQSRA